MEAKDSPVFMHTTVFLIQQSWMIIASLLSDCAHTYKFFENGVANEAIVLQWLVQTTSSDFKIVKKQWAGALLSVKCCCFVHNPSWKSHLWTSLSEEDKEEEEEEEEKERRRRNIVFHATKHVVDHEALENEWYIVIKAYKFIVFEILRFFCIIIYCVSTLSIPTRGVYRLNNLPTP